MLYNKAMKFILAQGNPGPDYASTRHNVGFRILEALAAAHQASFKDTPKLFARTATITHGGEKVLLILPQIFYNETGRAAQAVVAFYKADPAQDLLVIHDELALPLGTVRVRAKGSDGGNNGIKSLNAALGQDYYRIRIGIWSELRDRMADHDFVLSRFSKDESTTLEDTIVPKALELCTRFIEGSLAPESHSV